ncbi:SHOCT-like domain-containing protein [Caulobacter sp. KR2-114]|uniref:SHOCT-like domain-containing protein n=1 Tax=Caulobacter sp. KR2-114 TaxID=3400912 RepID=UPI003BFED504
MSDDRRAILGMLAEGKITADEADRLIAALGQPSQPPYADPAPVARPARAKYLRVVVDANDPQGPAKVNVRVPMQLLRAGVRLSALIPPQAREQVNAAMARQGIAFDLNQLKPENLEDLIEQLSDLTVDVDADNAKVRVFCE